MPRQLGFSIVNGLSDSMAHDQTLLVQCHDNAIIIAYNAVVALVKKTLSNDFDPMPRKAKSW